MRNAERFQAAGIILYSDPHDYNMDSTQEPYPKSWWLPSTGIQRGSISDDGDPLTPFYPSTGRYCTFHSKAQQITLRISSLFIQKHNILRNSRLFSP